jgi:hypothetical protein
MNDIVTFGNNTLPSAQELVEALRNVKPDTGPSALVFLKMDKTGHWVFGADQTEIDDNSTWAVNPFSFIHGFIAWGDGEVLGEKMVPMTQLRPQMDPPPANSKRGWELQFGCSLKCISGPDAGMEALFATNSKGGKEAVHKLGLDVAAQVVKDELKSVAIVRLRKSHYAHKSYGRIFTPVFDIIGWMGLDGQQEETPAAEAPAVETTVRRRRTA